MSTLEVFHLLTEHPKLGIAYFGNDERIFEINYGFSQLLGFEKNELVSLKITDFLHPDDSLQSPHPVRLMTKNSGWVFFDVKVRAVMDRRGRPISHICLIFRDVSERFTHSSQIDS